jgi:crotonobetainyl-CoA:carnitine CoA-transferase CaiB-like acyl-CoA transferase
VLNEGIEAVTITNTSAHWVEALNDQGVPCGPIYKVDEVFADPQVQHLGVAQTLNGGTLNGGDRNVAYVGQPIDMSRTPSSIVAHPPALGEHTDAVLAELGLDEATIADLRARHVV